uniref:Uncharacterized protein n=1 Tax=Culex tarsalis TaxID=7177 RepID=A0A1Q3F307_CULTA
MSSGALGSGHQLTADREFRYIVQWFSEWSDFQREDFVPVLAAYLAGGTGSAGTKAASPPYVNGIVGGMANLSGQDKPMSLFQCRVKLFNEWSSKWPETHREKLLERLTELDADFGQHVQRELSGEPAPSPQIPSADGDSTTNAEEDFADPGSALNANSTYYQQQQQQQQFHYQEPATESQPSPEPTVTTIAPATIALVIAED